LISSLLEEPNALGVAPLGVESAAARQTEQKPSQCHDGIRSPVFHLRLIRHFFYFRKMAARSKSIKTHYRLA
jgi:hypothetical protein